MSEKTVEQVQETHTDTWMAIPGVIGTAVGESDDRPCILILTSVPREQIEEQIPANVEGYPVVIQYTGEVRALDSNN
ncbi:hypothetical protein ACFL6U_23765 [Planctomycetota bacterium]